MNFISASLTAHPITEAGLHAHKAWEVILTTSGKTAVYIGNERFEISAGSIYVIPPNVPHEIKEGDPFTDIYFSATDLPFDGILVTHDFDGCFEPLMQLVYKMHMMGNHEPVIACLLEAICFYIKNCFGTTHKYPLVADFRSTLLEHLTDPNFKMAKAIKETGYSPDYFRRCFVSEYHMTPSQYLTQSKINKAKNLLRSTAFPISEISHQCGFSSAYYFSRKFLSIVGVSPLTYRKLKNREGM